MKVGGARGDTRGDTPWVWSLSTLDFDREGPLLTPKGWGVLLLQTYP